MSTGSLQRIYELPITFCERVCGVSGDISFRFPAKKIKFFLQLIYATLEMYGSEERLVRLSLVSVYSVIVLLVRLGSIFDGWLTKVMGLFAVRMMLWSFLQVSDRLTRLIFCRMRISPNVFICWYSSGAELYSSCTRDVPELY
jgi:hypothetical protein